jgi:hypothetical protein
MVTFLALNVELPPPLSGRLLLDCSNVKRGWLVPGFSELQPFAPDGVYSNQNSRPGQPVTFPTKKADLQ